MNRRIVIKANIKNSYGNRETLVQSFCMTRDTKMQRLKGHESITLAIENTFCRCY